MKRMAGVEDGILRKTEIHLKGMKAITGHLTDQEVDPPEEDSGHPLIPREQKDQLGRRDHLTGLIVDPQED